MGVEPQKISKRLDGDDRAGHPIPLWNHLLEKRPQGLPSTTTQIGEQRTVVEEIASKDLGNAEDKMTMEDLLTATTLSGSPPLRSQRVGLAHRPL